MTRPEAAPAGLGPPLAVRLILLMMIGWLITLIISLALVLLLPPPNQAVYRLSEIRAAALGGSLKPREGRPLQRTRQEDPPRRGEVRMTSGI